MQNTNQEYIRNKNTQDIFIRNAVISLLDLLNRQVIIDLVRGEEVEKFEIPFFYNFSSDEGFMKDFFMELPTDCKYPNFAEGNYERLPRGIVTLSSFSIKAQDITNKYVRGSFTQEEKDMNGQTKLKAYSSRLFVLPMSLTFSVKIESDNLNKMFKIIEKIFDFFYKNQVRYFQYRGIRIPAQITFPEDATFEKKYDFTYTDDQNVKLSLNLSMETYYPSFDDHSTFYKGNTIDQFNLRNQQLNGGRFGEPWVDQDFPPSE
jgi:hypothetical protein